MNNRKSHVAKIIFITVLACGIMIFIENYLQPAYGLKSALKLLVFLGGILLFSFWSKTNVLSAGLKPKGLKLSFVLAAGVYVVILLAFLLCKDFIDVEEIRTGLQSKEKIDRDNFIFVSIYISLVNSFLEEVFFRGFIFLAIYKTGLTKLAYCFSAMAFAVYHIGIISGWFNWYMYIIIIGALFAAGIIMDKLCQHGNSYLNSWVIHVAANLSINTIGFFIL